MSQSEVMHAIASVKPRGRRPPYPMTSILPHVHVDVILSNCVINVIKKSNYPAFNTE